ncbi:MAG: polysaccharide deacetylase family protein [Candidatus Taylorbacteria bacterium]
MNNGPITKRHWTQSMIGFCILLILGAVYISTEKKPHPATVVSPSASIRAHSIDEISRGDTTKQQVIFTFDAGSGIQSGQKILSVLAEHHVKGTFFMTGRFVEAYPDFVREVVSAGHEIFNHSYNHPYLTSIASVDVVNELNEMDVALAKITRGMASAPSVSTRPYFRAPYGDRNERVLKAAYRDGYESVYWTTDAYDWKGPEKVTDAEVTDRIISNIMPGSIYLMHVGNDITGRILDDVFTTIEGKGYKIVSLTEGM